MNGKQVKFEEALARLEEIVEKLEEGQVSLEKSLELFSEGVELAKYCNHHLEVAEEKIKVLVSGMNGKDYDPDIDKLAEDLVLGGEE